MISKQPTIDDIYNFDAYISTPGVREGLMQRATLEDTEFTLEDTDDGQAMYFNTPHGEQVFVGMPEQTMPGRQEGDVMLAEAGSRGLPEQAYSGRYPDTIKAIEPTRFEKALDNTGLTLEQAGRFLDNLGQVDVPLLGKISLADFVPFVGSVKEGSRTVMGPSVIQGTPMALQQAGTGQSLTTGTGFARKMTEDASLAAMDVGLNLVPTAKLLAKGGTALVKETGKQLNRAIMEGTGPLAAAVPQFARPMFIVEPSKFNPKVEVPKAVDLMANDPALSTFLPQAQRAPSVALRLTKPEIKGTGEKGILTVGDIGLVLEKTQLSMNKGKPLDPTKPKDLVKMVDSATAEAEYQMSQPITGATWYEDDVFQAFALGAKIVPKLATDEPLRVMSTAFAASTSYNKRASENWSVAMRITEDLMKTGKVPSRNPDNGKLWGGTTGRIMEKQLQLHQFMIDKMGMDDYSRWLLSPHTVKEIVSMKEASGLYASPSIPGKATDLKMGSFIMGEKGGAFFLNLNGIKETTADKWFTRTYNRHTGTLTSGNVSEQGLIDAPRNEAERSVMKTFNRSVAGNMNLDEQANQAVLWYYEQSLYYNLGIKSARSESFSDGAKTLLNARGIPFTDAELVGARGRSNASQAGSKPPSTDGSGDTVGLGLPAPAQAAAEPTSVTRGRRAPQSGAK